MFDLPIDALYLWVGLGAASLAFLGVAVALPSTPAPDAVRVADTVDTVAVSAHPSTAEHAVAADRVKVGPRRIALDGDGGNAHATFAYGPVTPVRGDSRLHDVLFGTPPDAAFDSPDAFRRAVERARDRQPRWQRANGRVVVRTVSWEESMRRSSARRGQVEPMAALAAVFAVGLALTATAGTFAAATPATERDLADPAMRRVLATTRTGSVLQPARLSAASAPAGYRLNVTVVAGDRRWHTGPTPPDAAASETRTVPVRTGPGRVQPGRVRVEVWT
ncbi:hypothetical protein ACFQH6_05165 [Halobacteriaceae archaeon GCM10025711]